MIRGAARAGRARVRRTRFAAWSARLRAELARNGGRLELDAPYGALFDDPLFVRTAHGMEPTPRAQALIAPAREVLSRVERDVLPGLAFDPATADVTFTFALSDVGEMVFLPRILERIQRLAPLASLRSVTPAPSDLREGLETGEIDLAVGYFPDLETNNFFQQRLFTHHF